MLEGFDVEWLAEVTEELLSDGLAFAGVWEREESNVRYPET